MNDGNVSDEGDDSDESLEDFEVEQKCLGLGQCGRVDGTGLVFAAYSGLMNKHTRERLSRLMTIRTASASL